jgi:hypothetical protein
MVDRFLGQHAVTVHFRVLVKGYSPAAPLQLPREGHRRGDAAKRGRIEPHDLQRPRIRETPQIVDSAGFIAAADG